MNRYETFLGNPLCRLFSRDYSEWEDSLEFILNYTGLDLSDLVKEWPNEDSRFINLRSFIEFIFKKGFRLGFLLRFVVNYSEDHYGKEVVDSYCYIIQNYLSSVDGIWVRDNKELFELLCNKESEEYKKLEKFKK